VIPLVLAALALLAPAAAGAGGSGGLAAPRPLVSLTASPSRVALAGQATATLELANTGATALRIGAAAEGLALDAEGRPALRRGGSRNAASWLVARPRALTLAAGERARVRLAVRLPARVAPGDHHAVLLFSTQPLHRPGVRVRMRVGVRVVVRAPGRIVRRLRVADVRARRSTRGTSLSVVLANGGNVTEELERGRGAVHLLRDGRLLARLRLPRRELLPGTRATVAVPYPARLRGRVVARVELRGGPRRSVVVRL
jgi:hypothetical protein